MKLTKRKIKNIALDLGLKNIIKVNDTDYQDNSIHEIILECLSHEKARFGTSLFDRLYRKYEKVIYRFMEELK